SGCLGRRPLAATYRPLPEECANCAQLFQHRVLWRPDDPHHNQTDEHDEHASRLRRDGSALNALNNVRLQECPLGIYVAASATLARARVDLIVSESTGYHMQCGEQGREVAHGWRFM